MCRRNGSTKLPKAEEIYERIDDQVAVSLIVLRFSWALVRPRHRMNFSEGGAQLLLVSIEAPPHLRQVWGLEALDFRSLGSECRRDALCRSPKTLVGDIVRLRRI